MNATTFTFTLIFIVFNWTSSQHAPLTTAISWSHSSPVQRTWTYDRRTIRWYNLVPPSECTITLELGILCSQVMWVRIMPRAATFASFNSSHHLSCPSAVRSQHLDRLVTPPIYIRNYKWRNLSTTPSAHCRRKTTSRQDADGFTNIARENREK